MIRVPEVRLINEDGDMEGVVPTRIALKRALNIGLDLIEISPNADPPVCKILDFGKYKYEQDKKKKESKKNQVVVKVKELKFRANTDDHDYQTKLRKGREFLEQGNRIKCSLFFRGRENAHTEQGFNLFQRIKADLEDVGVVEQDAKLNGKNLSMLISPAKS